MGTNIVVYIILEAVSLVWSASRDNSEGVGFLSFSKRNIALFVWVVVSVLFTLIYGGFFWW